MSGEKHTAGLTERDLEARGEDFAEALFGILALHGPPGLDTSERLSLGHHLCMTVTDWVRENNLAKAQTSPQGGV